MNRTEFKAQIEELRARKGIEALDPDGLDWLEKAFCTKFSDDLPLPYFYRFWASNVWDVRADWHGQIPGVDFCINLKTKSALWYQWDKAERKELDLSKDADWEWVVDRLFRWCPKPSDKQRKEPK